MITNRLMKAVELATKAHHGQLDKNGEPYIMHPLRVMIACTESEDQAIIGVLHDVGEDAPDMLDEVLECFGEKIWFSIGILTRIGLSETYAEYIERIKTARNADAIVVKLADLKDNLRPIHELRTDLRARYERAIRQLGGRVD